MRFGKDALDTTHQRRIVAGNGDRANGVSKLEAGEAITTI